jgi:hypothetical protein
MMWDDELTKAEVDLICGIMYIKYPPVRVYFNLILNEEAGFKPFLVAKTECIYELMLLAWILVVQL